MKDFSYHAIIELRRTLSEVISWVSAKEPPRMILAQRPLKLPEDVRVRREAAPSLRIDGKCKSNLYLAQYKKEGMCAIRLPYLCCVLEGEIDMRLGIPSRQGKHRDAITTYQIITLPARTFLFMPPGTFHSNRDEPYPPNMRLSPKTKVFWMRVLPTGGFVHSTSMQNGKLIVDYHDLFVPCPRLAMLTDMLMEELQSSDADSMKVAQHTLSALLSRTWRGLSGSAPAAVQKNKKKAKENPSDIAIDLLLPGKNAHIVDHACEYIRRHMNKPFTLEDVASYVYVSPPHLIRLFHAERKTTVMKYALNLRLEYAQSLLLNSELTVEEIARYVGYSQAPQFNRIFKRTHGINPTEFRRRHRGGAKLIIEAK